LMYEELLIEFLVKRCFVNSKVWVSEVDVWSFIMGLS